MPNLVPMWSILLKLQAVKHSGPVLWPTLYQHCRRYGRRKVSCAVYINYRLKVVSEAQLPTPAILWDQLCNVFMESFNLCGTLHSAGFFLILIN